MKYSKISAAIIGAIFIPYISNASTTYHSVIQNDIFKVKEATLIPNDNVGVNSTSKNINTNETKTSDITKSYMSLDAENGDLIELTSDVADAQYGTLSLTGQWNASTSTNFISNTKNKVNFLSPEYDGTYYINLELSDGKNNESYRALRVTNQVWNDTTPVYSEWVIDSIVTDWNPDSSTVFENESFLQTKTNDLTRTKQDRELRSATGEIRNVGDEITEYDYNIDETRTTDGTKEYWEETDLKIISDWVVTDVLVDWTPSPANVYETETVNQYREIRKERTVQDQEIRPATNVIRTVGSSYVDASLLNEYRDLQGELEYWENTGVSTCTEWALDRYDLWLPDASGFEKQDEVNQTRTKYESRSCTGEQVRPATGEIRNAESELEYKSNIETQTVNGTKIDLNDWGNSDERGTWVVSNDGSYVVQTVNGNSTTFESASDNYGNTVIQGKIRVRETAGDDDFIGMVVGKKDDDNFYLWSWKQKNQTVGTALAKEGHVLAEVTGSISSVTWDMDLDKTGYRVLDKVINTESGWEHGVYYNWEIKYTPTSIIIKLDGSEILSANGTFPTGKIGFFNFSQGNVEYYKVSETPIE